MLYAGSSIVCRKAGPVGNALTEALGDGGSLLITDCQDDPSKSLSPEFSICAMGIIVPCPQGCWESY